MKRLWLLVGLTILAGTVARTFADVQNIRLSGDIRMRAYYLNNVDDDGREDDSFISQRTRVTVEADLEDHILVVVTLKAEGLWGSDNNADESSGAGTGGAAGTDAINRRWEVGVTEAYVQFNEMFYSAVTLKLGRQYLHYGRGLILSSVEQEYNYDAARVVLDYYPLTFDLVYALACEGSSFGAVGNDNAEDLNLLFANVRYEMTDSVLKDIEVYLGWLGAGGAAPSTRVPPSALGTTAIAASPMIVGARMDLNVTENMNLWLEGAYEFGPDGDAATEYISAFILNAGGQFSMKDVAWTPMFNANYIYASGGGSEGKSFFRPWFNYTEGYNGYLFHPYLSNLHIFNVGASVKPAENTTLAVQGYYYLKADRNDSFAGSDPNIDLGTTGMIADGDSREVGWEIDTILGYDYSKDVRAQLVYAAFLPEAAVRRDGSNAVEISAVAHEVRAEVNVRF